MQQPNYTVPPDSLGLYLRDRFDASPEHISGILANIWAESNFDPAAVEIENYPNRRQGKGLMQWTYPSRQDGLFEHVPDWKTNWKGQMDYAFGIEDEGKRYLRTPFTSAEQATEWLTRHNLNPANVDQAVVRRQNYLRRQDPVATLSVDAENRPIPQAPPEATPPAPVMGQQPTVASQGADTGISKYLQALLAQQQQGFNLQREQVGISRDAQATSRDMQNRWFDLLQQQQDFQMRSQQMVNPLETIIRNVGQAGINLGQGLRGRYGHGMGTAQLGSAIGRGASRLVSPIIQAGQNMFNPSNIVGRGRDNLLDLNQLQV